MGATATPAGKAAPGKSQGLLWAMIAGGGLGLAALAGVAVVLLGGLGGGGSGAAPGKASAGGGKGPASAAEIVLDWPSAERRQAELLVNNRKEQLLPTGDVKISVKPGKHTLTIRRRGFAPIDEVFELAAGEIKSFKPEWKPADALTQVTPSTSPVAGGSSFPLGTAAPAETAPEGFDGFRQNMTAAERDARAQKRNILLVFGSSDSDGETQQLARALTQEPAKSRLAAEYIPVVVDFPRTAAGQGNVFDLAQNNALAESYRIQSLPTLIAIDAGSRPFYRQSEFSAGLGNVSSYLDAAKSALAERDQKLLAAESGDLALCAAANSWILANRFAPFYEPEIDNWRRKAQAADADNAQGLFEQFFESSLAIEVHKLGEPDNLDVQRIAGQMANWLGKKFKDPNRGVRLNMLVCLLAARGDVVAVMQKHLDEARSYEPTDPQLKSALANIENQLRNRNVKGSGTGWLVAPGYVLTNHHVIAGAGKVALRLPGQKDTTPASVIASDAKRDAALLKVEFPAGFSAQPLAISRDETGRGAPVAAFGFPLGDQIGGGLKFTAGVVSALPDSANEGMMLLDLRINPGNSGGPLCNMQGHVIGMITAKTSGVFNDSYGLSIPCADLHTFLDKHLPAGAERATAPADSPQLAGWDKVDKLVSPAVFMILALE